MTYLFVEGAAEHILNFTFSHLRLLKCSSNNFWKNKKSLSISMQSCFISERHWNLIMKIHCQR